MPVYREDIRLRQTMRTSVELLSEGHSIVLCPDVDYQSKSAFMGETYAGFAGIAGDDPLPQRGGCRVHPGTLQQGGKNHLYRCADLLRRGRVGRQACAQQIARALNSMAGACQEEMPVPSEVPEQVET